MKCKINYLYYMIFKITTGLNVKIFAIKLCLWDIFSNYTDIIRNQINNDPNFMNTPLELEAIEYWENTVISLSTYNCDIVMIDPLWILSPDFYKNMVGITSYVKETIDARIKADKTNIYGDLIEDNMNFPDGAINREIYGIPFFLDFGVLYYNINKVNNVPITWNDLEKWAEVYDNNKNGNSINKDTKYGAQFTEYREYYYNFVEATANFGDKEEFTLFEEEAKGAINNFSNLFNKDILNEKAWNQNAQLMKNTFCNGDVVYMRNWSIFDYYIRQNCNNLNYGKTKIPKSKDRKGDTKTLVRSISLAMTKLVEEKNQPTVAKIMENLTSKEFMSQLMLNPVFQDIPPYIDLVTNSRGSQYCEFIDCSFYLDLTKNLLTKPIGRFSQHDKDDHFNNIIKDSYSVIKEKYYKDGEKNSEILDRLSSFFDDKYIKWSDMSAIVIGSISGIGIVVTVVVFFIVIKNRSALVIRRSSPLFLYFMLIGILISFGSVLTCIGKPTEFICTIRPIILVLAFGLSFLALFIKTFRIKVIFDKSDIKVQDKFLLIYSGSILLIELIIVAIWTVLDKMKPDVIYINTEMHYYTCKNNGTLGTYFQLSLIIINAIILLYGCYLAIKVKDVYSDYNESKVIGLSIYGIMICMIVQLIISYNVSLGHSVIFIIQSLMIILSSVILLLFMFIPKFWKLHMTGSSANHSSGNKNSSQRLPVSTNNNNQNGSYSDKNGYINMQSVENDYYNNLAQLNQMSNPMNNQMSNQMGSLQRNNFYNNNMNGSSESIGNYYNNNINPYNYRNNSKPDMYTQYNY
ncbi:hypothetical protein PIROE2DRAFT_2790 [Piromyces sp. E2]|nr:hypothetical protein PIROE2DRAFT_2790 [Piromyces sp. E2]|eukprot:OUM69290.1 hypothetical protein PIROE2DRAFT_2790 [Piromyces sp. E2]